MEKNEADYGTFHGNKVMHRNASMYAKIIQLMNSSI